jgi:hypothetical protein
MICEGCGAENPSDETECQFCGTPLEVVDELTGEYVGGFHDLMDEVEETPIGD